jgi:hypothetical protein
MLLVLRNHQLDKNWILLTIPIYTKASLKYFNQLILKNFKLILVKNPSVIYPQEWLYFWIFFEDT